MFVCGRYGRVPIGGFLIFDDYGDQESARACWSDFQKEQGFTAELTNIDWTGAFMRKNASSAPTVDWSRYRTGSAARRE